MLHFLRYVLITVYLFRVNSSRFFDLFEKYNGHITGRLKLKRPKQLQEVLDVARFLIADPSERLCEKPQKLDQLKTVLEMYVFFMLALLWFYFECSLNWEWEVTIFNDT